MEQTIPHWIAIRQEATDLLGEIWRDEDSFIAQADHAMGGLGLYSQW